MSWEEELWVAVSLIQSAPHRAVQYTASVLIVRYAFPTMHNCFCSRFLSTYSSSERERERERERENHTLVNSFTRTKCLCVAHKQVHILHPATTTHTCTQFPFSSLWDTQIDNPFAFELSHSGLYIFFINILFCHCVLIWADLYCAVCCLCTFNDTVGSELGKSCEGSASCILNWIEIRISNMILITQWNLISLIYFCISNTNIMLRD